MGFLIVIGLLIAVVCITKTENSKRDKKLEDALNEAIKLPEIQQIIYKDKILKKNPAISGKQNIDTQSLTKTEAETNSISELDIKDKETPHSKSSLNKRICSAFLLDDPVEALKHIEAGKQVIKNYGSRCGSSILHTWDDGCRILYQCTLCGGFILGQFSEFHGMENDDYYSDYFPVDSPEDADLINAKYDGEHIETEFPERWLIADPGYPHWKAGYSDTQQPQASDYDPEQPLRTIQFPHFVACKPSPETTPSNAGTLTDESLSFSDKLHNRVVQELIHQCKTHGQKADQFALLMGINGSRLIVPEEITTTDIDQSRGTETTQSICRNAFCFLTDNHDLYIAAFTQENLISKEVLQSCAATSNYSLVDLAKACKAFKPPFRGIVVNGFDEKQEWVLSPTDVQIALFARPLSGTEMDPGDNISIFLTRKTVLIEDCNRKQEMIKAQISEAEKMRTENAFRLLLLHSNLRYLNARRSVLEKYEYENEK